VYGRKSRHPGARLCLSNREEMLFYVIHPYLGLPLTFFDNALASGFGDVIVSYSFL